MDSSEEKKYLERIEEFVEDEDKIVTVPFLARTLEISVQDSLKLLQKYIENRKKSHPNNLTVTYVITGTLKNGSGITVCMVTESEVEEKKNSFQNLVSEVIYSIQKAKIVDFNIVALVDWSTTDPIILPGTVCSKNCIKRTLRVKVLPSPPKPTLKGKSSYFIPKTERSTEKPTEKPTESNAKAKPTGGVADLFNKATISKAKQPEHKTNNLKPKNASSKSKGTLSSFLSKSSSTSVNSTESEGKINGQENKREANSIVSSSKGNEENEIKDDDFDNFMEVDCDEKMEEIMNEKEETKKVKGETNNERKETEKEMKDENVKSSTKKNKKKHSKRKRDASEDKDIKRRKRIIQFNESDSDDIFERDDDIIETSEPEPERVASPLPRKILPPKNKRRKTVENTYVDDEGFVVTKTEYVYETASEDENEQSLKSLPKKEEQTKKENGITKKSSNSSEGENSPKTVAAKGGKKGKKNNLQNQPTLMNFFKKK